MRTASSMRTSIVRLAYRQLSQRQTCVTAFTSIFAPSQSALRLYQPATILPQLRLSSTDSTSPKRSPSEQTDERKATIPSTGNNPLTNRNGETEAEAAERKRAVKAWKAQQAQYQLTFTCGKCMERSSHQISKQGYHCGTVLVNCPSCKNKHLISDHLKIFSDRGITLEDIMKEKGELIKKGTLGADGDVEFYPDEIE